jgi:hypothetical protein
MSHHHSITNEVATYARGQKHLDYLFCTSNLLPSVVSWGIAPFNEHIFSDHRSKFVDWDKVVLFGSAAPLLSAPSARRLQLKNLVTKNTYLLSIKEYCNKHNVFKWMSDLQSQTEPDWSAAEN